MHGGRPTRFDQPDDAPAGRGHPPVTILLMPLSEADTHAKLVNPAIYVRGWTEDHIKREETTGAVDIIAGKARRRSRGRTDLTLRIVVIAEMQPVAVAVIEVKKDTLPPGHGLDQAKGYAKSKRLENDSSPLSASARRSSPDRSNPAISSGVGSSRFSFPMRVRFSSSGELIRGADDEDQRLLRDA